MDQNQRTTGGQCLFKLTAESSTPGSMPTASGSFEMLPWITHGRWDQLEHDQPGRRVPIP